MDFNIDVLIVDDFATMRRILKNTLKQMGFVNIAEAEDGKIAFKILRKKDFGLILSDWNMTKILFP